MKQKHAPPANLLYNVHYNALGQITSDSTAYGEIEAYNYDNRGRQTSANITFNAHPVYSFSITSFAPNGNVLASTDSSNGNWTYSYDQFNRLTGANQNTGAAVYNYVYDRFGNRWQQNGPHSMLLTFSGTNNRVDGYSYDAAGNLIGDGTHTYSYDAENRLIKIDNGNTSTFVYDGEGHRFSKTNSSAINSGGSTPDPAGTTAFIYDPQGHLVHTEAPSTGSGGAGTSWRGEVFAGNRHLATYAGNLLIAHADWIGTERNRDAPDSNAPQYPVNQNITALPFGDWIDNSLGLSLEETPLNFTGQYHDFESDLDYFGARYYSSTQGRFMRPDPDNAGARIENPQSWNAYSYVLNNPLNAVDPFGLDCIYVNNDTGEYQGFNKGDCDNSTEEKANSGYYVNGDVDQSSIAFTGGDANRVFYTYTNDQTVGPQYGNQCVGNCSDADTTVNVYAPLPPGIPTMSANPGDQIQLSPWGLQHQTSLKFTTLLGALAGMDPAYCGPINAHL